jgi:Cell envelope opacity-associated protein A
MRTKQQNMRGVAMKLTAMRSYWNKLRAGWREKLTAGWENRPSVKSLHGLTGLKQGWQRLPALHRRLLMVLIPTVLVLAVLPSPSPKAPSPQTRQPVALNTGANVSSASQNDSSVAASTAEPATQQAEKKENSPWVSHQIESGDTLAKVFRHYDLALTDLYSIANIEGEGNPISRIQPGQWIRFKRTASGALDILQIETDKGQSALYFRLSDGSFARQR